MTSDEEFDEQELESLKRAAQALPREVAPDADAWASIRSRIELSRVRELPVGRDAADAPAASTIAPDSRPATGSVRSWFRTPQAALLIAASMLIAVTTLVVKQQSSVDDTTAGRVAADTARTDLSGVFARYDGAASDLATDFDRRRALLDPSTVAVMDSCLTTLDNAIRETRDALSEAPDNATIAELLEVTYQQKLDLLRRAAELAEGSL